MSDSDTVIKITDLVKEYKMFARKKDRLLEAIIPGYQRHGVWRSESHTPAIPGDHGGTLWARCRMHYQPRGNGRRLSGGGRRIGKGKGRPCQREL